MGVKVTNNAFGTISAGISSTDTTITLDSGQGARFPTLGAGDYFYGTLVDTSNTTEIVKVTARSTDSMTVVRGQDNTTASAFAIGDRFELRPTAALFEALDLTEGGTVSGALNISESSSSTSTFNRTSTDGTIVTFQKDSSTVGTIGSSSGKLTVNSGGTNLVFQTGGTSRVNMDNSQMYPQTDGAMSLGHPSVRWNNLRLTGSINFDSSSAGLDAYEEGTWTAYVSDVNGNNPVSGGTMGYVRIGNVMYLFGQASFVNVNAYIGGSQAYLWTPTAPRNAFRQSSNDVLIPCWHSGTAASMNYWDNGYPSISMSTGNTRHPLFRHKYNGADGISGASLGSGDFRVNFNGFFYYE